MRYEIEFVVNSDPYYFFLFTIFKSLISSHQISLKLIINT